MDLEVLTTEEISKLDRTELKQWLFRLQEQLGQMMNSGQTMDEILEKQDPFEAIEPLLPTELFPIFVLAMINETRSDSVIDSILDGFERNQWQ